MNKKALVTGASGFVGSTLVHELVKSGFEVFALMRKSSSPENLKHTACQRVEGSLSDLESLKKAVRGMDYVFHVAGVIQAPSLQGFMESNALGTRRLAQAVAEENPGVRKFVYVSSLAAGGPMTSLVPRHEAHPDEPVSAYGKSKRQGELELLAHKDRFPVVIVRPPIIYGPRDRGVFTLVKMISRNVMPLLPSSTETGCKYLSSIYVQDLCAGLVQCALSDPAHVHSGEVFYLSADVIHTDRDLLQEIAKHLGKRPLRLRVPKALIVAAATGMSTISRFTGKNFTFSSDKLNELLPDYWICSNEKAKRLLRFSPGFDLAKGMAETMEWYKREGWV